jgi:hypothetical protein
LHLIAAAAITTISSIFTITAITTIAVTLCESDLAAGQDDCREGGNQSFALHVGLPWIEKYSSRAPWGARKGLLAARSER